MALVKRALPPMLVTVSLAVASFLAADVFLQVQKNETRAAENRIMIDSTKSDIKQIKNMQERILHVLLTNKDNK